MHVFGPQAFFAKTRIESSVTSVFSAGAEQLSNSVRTQMVARTSRPRSNETSPLDLLTEDMIGLSKVPGELPGRINTSTVWRWTQRGVGGVKLETVNIGGKKMTSRQALSRFIAATSRN